MLLVFLNSAFELFISEASQNGEEFLFYKEKPYQQYKL